MASKSELNLMTQILDLEGFKVIDYCLNDELDATRRKIKRETQKIKSKSKKEKILEGLKKSKYVLLKNKEDLKEAEQEKLEEVKKVAPVLIEMYNLKEELRDIFEPSKDWSEGLLNIADWFKDIS